MNNELERVSFHSEEWKPIADFEGLYSISNRGKVFSHRSKKVLRPVKNTQGYLQVKLYKESKVKRTLVHRLVLSAFAPRDASDALECNHLNGVKGDNRLVNLEWVTKSENQRHSVDVLGNYHGPDRKAVVQFSRDGIRLNVFRSTWDAERATGVYQSNICSCAKGYRKQAGGYVWKYLTDLPQEEAA